MDLIEKTQGVVELMKETKEKWVAQCAERGEIGPGEDPGSDTTDLAIYEHYYRGDDLVAMVQCPLDREKALKAALLACSAFNADTMTVTFESYSTDLRESPITGERWAPKEMQFVAQTVPDAVDKGWVHECLTTSAHERGGTYMLVSQGYRIEDGQMTWLDPKIMDPEHESKAAAEGYMFENLQRAMTIPPMEELIAERAKEDPTAALLGGVFADQPERRQFHIDMATAQALETNGLAVGVMLMANEGSPRAEWLEERMGEPGVHLSDIEEF